MKAVIRRVGNSFGVIIPKPILAQLGWDSEVEMLIENNMLILKKPQKNIRKGWSEASKHIVSSGDDTLVFPDFITGDDEKWT